MSADSHQTNSQNFRNLYPLLKGEKPAGDVLPLDFHPASANHLLEANAVQVGLHCLVAPDPVKGAAALAGLVSLLEDQAGDANGKGALGFMCVRGPRNETLTNDHATIWLRAILAALIFAQAIDAKGSTPASARLLELLYWWLESWRAVSGLLLVPSGPEKGQIIGPFGRGNKALAGDKVNAAVYKISGGGKGSLTGLNAKKALILSLDAPDNAAVALAARIAAAPSRNFGPNFLRGNLPKMPDGLTVRRGPEGHVAAFDQVSHAAGDSARSCWVSFPDGRFSYGDDPAPFDHVDRVTRLSGVGE